MALSRLSPMGELAGLHTAMDRLFGDFFGSPLSDGSETTSRTWYLPVDIVDQGSAYQIRAAVPGFTPEDVEVTFAEGTLTISAERKHESTSRAENYLRRELSVGNYSRSVMLPGEIKEKEITASFDNGILTVEVPKLPAAQPIKIEVTGKSQKQFVGTGPRK